MSVITFDVQRFVSYRYGTNDNDTIRNDSSNVVVFSYGGDDKIYSEGNYVTIYGDDGNDSIDNGSTWRHPSLSSDVVIYGGNGNDRLYNNLSPNVTINGGGGDDDIQNYGGLSRGDYGNDDIWNCGSNATIDGGADNDTLTNYAGVGVQIIGGTGNDVIKNFYGYNINNFEVYNNGNNGDATINAGDGNDSIFNADINALIDAGAGDDTVQNYGVRATILGGNGNDSIFSYYGANVMIDGGSGADNIYNGSSNSTIIGGDGNDTIDHAASNSTVDGGAGDDSIFSAGNNILVDGGDGRDLIRHGAAYSKNFTSNATISGGRGADTLEIYNGDSLRVAGGEDDDFIRDSSDNTYLTISGDAGNDTIVNYSATVTIDGGAGNDSVFNNAHDVTISGGDGDDTISNSGVSVIINGGEGNDTILNSGEGVTIKGGTGSDLFDLFSYNDVVIMDYESADALSFRGTLNGASLEGSDVVINMNDGSFKLLGAKDKQITITDSSNKTIKFTNSYDTNSGGDNSPSDNEDYLPNNVTLGTEGNERFNVYQSDLFVRAGGGNDTIACYGVQNVYIETGAGKDVIYLPYTYSENGKSSSEYCGPVNIVITDFDPNNDILHFPEWAFFYDTYYFRASLNDDGDLVLKDRVIGNYTMTFKGITSTDQIKNTRVIRWEGYGGTLGGILYNTIKGSNSNDSPGGGGEDLTDGGENDLFNNKLNNITIDGTNDSDAIHNQGNNVKINGGNGNDEIYNYLITNTANGVPSIASGKNVTINGGAGDDYISCNSTDHVIYSDGDGNDTISGTPTVHLSGEFQGAKLNGKHVILNVGDGSITLYDAKGQPVNIVDGNGQTLTFTGGDYEIPKFARKINTGETITATSHTGFFGEEITGNNGTAFVSNNDVVIADANRNIVEIRIANKSHKIKTPLNRGIYKDLIVKDPEGNIIAIVKYGEINISWKDGNYVFEAADKSKPVSIETKVDGARVIGGNKDDDITISGANSYVDSRLGGDSITNNSVGTTIIGGRDDDTISGNIATFKLNFGTIKEAMTKGSDVIITVGDSPNGDEYSITVKNGKDKKLTVFNATGKKFEFKDNFEGDSELWTRAADNLVQNTENELTSNIARQIKTTASFSVADAEALATLKKNFTVSPASAASQIPDALYERIATNIYDKIDKSAFEGLTVFNNALVLQQWVVKVAQEISKIGETSFHESFGDHTYDVDVTSFIAFKTGSAHVTIKRDGKSFATMNFIADEEQTAGAIAEFCKTLNKLADDALWNAVISTAQDFLKITDRQATLTTYVKEVVKAIVSNDTGDLDSALYGIFKSEIDATSVRSALRDFLEKTCGVAILDLVDTFGQIENLRAQMNDTDNTSKIKQIFDEMDARVNGFIKKFDGTPIGQVSSITLDSKNLSAVGSALKASEFADAVDSKTPVYLSAVGNVTADTETAIAVVRSSNFNQIRYTFLKDDDQNFSFGTENDTKNWIIKMGGGNDSVTAASSANATIYGGSGDDIISFKNSAVNNVIVYDAGDGDDTIIGYNSANTISITGATYTTSTVGSDVMLKIGSGSILMKDASDKTVNIRDDNDTTGVLINGSTLTATATFTGNEINLADYESAVANVNAAPLSNSVTIVGSSADNYLKGGKGADTIYGGAGNDTVVLGAGNDVYVYTSGNDVIQDYKSGQDKLKLASASITGASVNGKNVILQTSEGNITVKGAKNNAITVIDSAGNETTNVYPINTIPAGISVKNATLTASTDFIGSEINLADYSSKVTKVNASALSNGITIVGTAAANSVKGGKGDDTIIGGAGNDKISLGAGNDVYVYSGGNDLIYDYQSGEDKIKLDGVSITGASNSGRNVILQTSEGNITVKGGKNAQITVIDSAGNEMTNVYPISTIPAGISVKNATLTASTDFTDSEINLADYASKVTKVNASALSNGITIVGTAAANSVKGGKGDDTIIGGAGNDKISLGAGNDVYVYSGGNDLIYDYQSGEDKIKLDGVSITGASNSGRNVILQTSEGNITVKGGKNAQITVIDSAGNETSNVYPLDTMPSGLSYDLSKKTLVVSNSYNGDTIDLANFATTVKTVNASALSQNVNIAGNSQNNTLTGGVGNDTLTGGAGKDVFGYGRGNDVIADYETGDMIQLSSGEINRTSYSGNDVVFTIDTGTLTVKNGNGMKIKIRDANNRTSTRTYSSGTRNSNALWFTADDDNFIGSTNNLDAVTEDKFAITNVENTSISYFAYDYTLTPQNINSVTAINAKTNAST